MKLTISYPTNFNKLADLDYLFNALADQYCCRRIGGYYLDGGRYIVYHVPDGPYLEEFKDALKRIGGCHVESAGVSS